MKKNKIDLSDLMSFLALFFFGVLFLGVIPVYFGDKVAFEQECVLYYKEHNGYILERCEVYKDKMISIEVLE